MMIELLVVGEILNVGADLVCSLGSVWFFFVHKEKEENIADVPKITL